MLDHSNIIENVMADKVAKNGIFNSSTRYKTRCTYNTLNQILLYLYVAGKLEILLHEIKKDVFT